jgi:PAS domain S-box-containing protein
MVGVMRLSLRSQLLGVTVALLALLTLGALGAVYYFIGEQVRQQARRDLRAAAQVLERTLEHTQLQLLGRGRVLVELPSLRTALTTEPAFLEPLLQEVKGVRAANLLFATDAAGAVLAGTAEYPPPQAPLGQHALVAAALRREAAAGLDFFLGDWWLLLALPVLSEDGSRTLGTVALGLLIGESYLARLAELLGADVGLLWQGRQLWSAGWPQLLRERLPGQAPSALGREAREEALDARGRYLWAAQRVRVGEAPNMSEAVALLGTRVNEAVIEQTARAIGWIALLIVALGFLALTGAIRSITEPLKRLVADSRRVGAGELTHRAAVRGAREVAQLAGSFNAMVGSLQRSRGELEQEKAATENIINRTINSLIVTDADGVIRRANPATEDLLGYTQAELAGQPMTLVCAQPVPGEVRNLECAYRTKSGRLVPVLFSSALMRDEAGRVQGMVCVAQDITERKHLERLKDEFIGTVSHELRTPLTTIEGGLALFLDGILGPITDEQRNFLESTSRQTQRLRRLVTLLLNLSALQSGQLEVARQPFDLVEVIRQACASCRALAGGRTLHQQLAPAPPAVGDRRWILEVVEELLRNAVQFTQEDGVITVSLQESEGWLEVTVSDDGVGIPREEQARLFQPFVQPGRAEQERSGGSGLGLVFCRHVIERQGGRIWVRSESERGASFMFTLPSQAQAPAPGLDTAARGQA